MPSTMWRTLHALSHLILITAQKVNTHDSHFIAEEVDAPRSDLAKSS